MSFSKLNESFYDGMSLELTFCYYFCRQNFAGKKIKTSTQNINFHLWKALNFLSYANVVVVNLIGRGGEGEEGSIRYFISLHLFLIYKKFECSMYSLHKYLRKKKVHHGSSFETSTLTITTILKVCECCKNNLDNDKLILVLPKIATHKINVTKGMMVKW